jgi:hypothetical protein
MKKRITGVIFLWIIVCGIFTATRIDNYPRIHTFGVSFGTNSHYCSADFVRTDFIWSCESAS